MTTSAPFRQPCPPGACVCDQQTLRDLPGADLRILLLTRQEEKRLLARLENISSLEDLQHMQQRMEQQLGIRMEIAPATGEVRSMRGIHIHIADMPGLCRRTRQEIPRAIRRGLEHNQAIAWRLLDAHDLLRDA